MSGIYTIPTQNALQSTLDAELAAGGTSMTLADDWSSYFTGVSANNPAILVIDRQDANGTDIPSKREYVKVTNVSGATFTIGTRGMNGSTDQVHSVGARVECVTDVETWKSMKDTFEVEHVSTDGTHDFSSSNVDFQGISLGAGTTMTAVLDEDDMASDSATSLATQQSIKAYVDGKIIDEDDMASDSATKVPTQQSVKAYVDGRASGKVLQVINASYSTVNNTTNTTLTDTGLSATITPSSTSSKILVFVKTGEMKTADANTGIYVALVRGSTEIAQITKYACFPTANLRQYSSVTYLDSPATTSATTYKTQFKRQVGSGTVTHCEDGTTSFITLMEIGA